MDHFDVVIIGGGLVGLSLASALKPWLGSNKQVLVVEQSSAPNTNNRSVSFDDRSTAISFGSQQTLDDIGVWQHLSRPQSAIEKIQVSEQGNIAHAQLDAASLGFSSFGYVVANSELGHALHQSCQHPQIKTLYQHEAKQLIPIQGGYQITLESQDGQLSELKTSLVVVADGGRSNLKEQLGINDETTEYHQQAFICNIKTQQPHKQQAYERFSKHGPMALLPLKQPNESALVWTQSDEKIMQCMTDLSTEAGTAKIKQEIASMFGYRLGPVQQISKPAAYPLIKTMAKEQIRPHLVLLGNSAASLHPVAGQGFNLALYGVKALAKNITATDTLGSMSQLVPYFDQVKSRQQQIGFFSHGLIKSFENQNEILQILRSAGLYMLDHHRYAKQPFSRFTMGLPL